MTSASVSGYWLDIALIAVLVLLNAAFAGSEMALVSLREGQLKALEREGSVGARRLVRLARDPNRFLATIQIGITLAGFLASATAAVSLAEPLVPVFGAFGSWAEPVAIAVVTLVLTFLTLVFGELAPKRLAMQHSLRWARMAARPLDLLSALSRPLVAVLSAASDLVVRLLGGRPDARPEDISADELRELVRTHRVLQPEQREIITGALELHERTLREVHVPRASTLWLDPHLSLDEAAAVLAASGHSRAPVLSREHTDRVLGIVHWAAVVGGGSAPVSTVAVPALFLPDTLAVDSALRTFKSARAHMAVVVDEHGQVDGIVTLEDVLEEIVGEIYDETDKDVLAINLVEDGPTPFPGSFPVHDLPDLGIELDPPADGDYTTLAGLLIARLGHIPEGPGETVMLNDRWEARVAEVVDHAVTEVTLTPRAPGAIA